MGGRTWREGSGHGHPKSSSGHCAILRVGEEALEKLVFMNIYPPATLAEWIIAFSIIFLPSTFS